MGSPEVTRVPILVPYRRSNTDLKHTKSHCLSTVVIWELDHRTSSESSFYRNIHNLMEISLGHWRGGIRKTKDISGNILICIKQNTLVKISSLSTICISCFFCMHTAHLMRTTYYLERTTESITHDIISCTDDMILCAWDNVIIPRNVTFNIVYRI